MTRDTVEEFYATCEPEHGLMDPRPELKRLKRLQETVGVFGGEHREYRRKKRFIAMRIYGPFRLAGPDGERRFQDGYAILGDDGLWHGMEKADFEGVFEPADLADAAYQQGVCDGCRNPN